MQTLQSQAKLHDYNQREILEPFLFRDGLHKQMRIVLISDCGAEQMTQVERGL